MSIKIQYITQQGHLYHRCNLKTKTKTKNPKLGLEYNDWNVGENMKGWASEIWAQWRHSSRISGSPFLRAMDTQHFRKADEPKQLMY